MARQELNQTFTKLIREVGLDGRGARARPRPHDLRHAFTVRTLLDWHEADDQIGKLNDAPHPSGRQPDDDAQHRPSCSS